MSNIIFKTDTTEVQGMIDYFKNNDWIRAESNALKKASNAVKRHNRKRMKELIPNATKRNPKYTDRLIDAIRSSKVKRKPNELLVKVHTMGTKNKTSGTYRARFFNNSKEVERQTHAFTDKLGRFYKNGRKTGVLKQIHYFDDNPQSIIKDSLDKDIKDAIEKVNNKKYNK